MPDTDGEESGIGGVVIPTAIGAFLGNLLLPGIGGIALGSLAGGMLGATSNKDKKWLKHPYSIVFTSIMT